VRGTAVQRPRGRLGTQPDAQRRADDLHAALATPFRCRWTFDVELIARFVVLKRGRAPAQQAAALIYELPLRHWTDVPGSKLSFLDAFRMGLELLGIAHTYFLRSSWQPPPRLAGGTPAASVPPPPAAPRSRAASPRVRRR
jgi:hypothetical protein